MTSFRSEYLGQNDLPSLIFCFVLSSPGPTNQPSVHFLVQNNAAKRSIPVTERPKVSPRLQTNPQVAQSSPQVDTQVAQSMLKVPQGRPQVAPSNLRVAQINPRVAPSNHQAAQRSPQVAQRFPQSSQSHHRHCVSEPLVYIMLWVAGGNCALKVS